MDYPYYVGVIQQCHCKNKIRRTRAALGLSLDFVSRAVRMRLSGTMLLNSGGSNDDDGHVDITDFYRWEEGTACQWANIDLPLFESITTIYLSCLWIASSNTVSIVAKAVFKYCEWTTEHLRLEHYGPTSWEPFNKQILRCMPCLVLT